MHRTVLFFHSGRLGDFFLGRREWRKNADPHQRAFLRSQGVAVTSMAPRSSNAGRSMMFWGEWEADAWSHELYGSRATRNSPGCYLEPRPRRRSNYSGLHNTDPFVFGGPFLYSNCMQPSFPNALGDLQKGDVVLFGSNVADEFALDTVLVISERHAFHPASWQKDLPPELVRPSFEVATLSPLVSGRRDDDGTRCVPTDQMLTLYVGATPANPRSDGAFSFVPAKLVDDEPAPFARPVIAATEQNQGVAAGVPISWHEVAQSVLDSGLVLATSFDEPPVS
jgi:hypothetical protein